MSSGIFEIIGKLVVVALAVFGAYAAINLLFSSNPAPLTEPLTVHGGEQTTNTPRRPLTEYVTEEVAKDFTQDFTQDIKDTPFSARIVRVIDGDTVLLNSGVEIRMTGIQAPKLPLGRKNFRKWPMADAAKNYLEALALDQQIEITPSDQPQDRWGRVLAQLHNDEGIWLQGAMVQAGMARVYTFADNAKHADALYVLEREARFDRKGIWSLDYYAILSPETAAQHENSFQLIEGVIVDVANVRGRVYLNFGEDYRSDFTISIKSKVRRAFDRAGRDLMALKGRRVRVRGWLRDWNGPLVELGHLEQLEILDP